MPYKRHAALFAGTQQYAREHGWESIIDEFVAENLPARSKSNLPYDGVIARTSDKLHRRASSLGLPLVNVWFNSPIMTKRPGVFPDFAAIGRLKAEHLLARGFRRFAAILREDRGQRLETAAFIDTVEKAGFACAKATIPLHSTRDHATWVKLQQIISASMDCWQPPVGVTAHDESVGRMILQMCGTRDWHVPRDVAIIAGWNEDVLCNDPRPSLTSVEPGYEQIGYAAARMLDGLMDEADTAKRSAKRPNLTRVMMPPQGVIVRESTDFYAVEDEIVAAALQFIAAHSHAAINPNDVAKSVSQEPRTLRRRFRRFLGRPIASEIRRARIERAKRELLQSDRSLDAIAFDVGFETGRQLRDAFRRELGVTPGEFRHQERSGGSPA
ncbi:hypothetical protein C5Y93_12380 [Blastopirellula marina]|uniref:HTH araC/xylS-type domain-containing protein n=1 Tax=Blastopirellula marina TaxID=124 RepID=A0A2S8GMY1_9BACT|nr:hypothetical protein C5Y93_12380 [Blastopirellula marina]